MLSDEEREALRNFKSEYETCNHNSSDLIIELDDANIILNLIEKKSKEIEELKEKNKELKTQIEEHVYYDLGGRSCGKTELLRHYKKGYDMNNKFWKDKIKAKREELNNKLKNADEIEAVFIIKQQQVLQSLLEKE